MKSSPSERRICTVIGKVGVKMRSGILDLGFGLLVLGMLCSQPSAFSQKTSQPVLTRRIKVRIEPSYPERARPLKLAGKVRVEVIVSPDGSIKNTRVVGGSPLLVDASLEAIKQWKFEPGPKETVEKIEFLFQLK
jgi:TonB family protein